MVHFYAVPGCSNHSDRDSQVSYHCLPLRNKPLLKQWIHKIGRRNLPLNESTCVCSDHFINSRGRMLRLDEVPSLKLPVLPTQIVPLQPRRQLLRSTLPEPSDKELSVSNVSNGDAATNTDLTGADLESLEGQVCQLKEIVVQLEHECKNLKAKQPFRLRNIGADDIKVKFYTGFSLMAALMVCFNFLGPSVKTLNYWSSRSTVSRIFNT